MLFKVESAIGAFASWPTVDFVFMRILSQSTGSYFCHYTFSRNVKAEGHLGLPSTVGSFHTTGSKIRKKWDTKLTSIKGLVQSTLDHFRTLCPQDSQQAILEELEKLKAENAALKASQAPDSGNPPSQTDAAAPNRPSPNQCVFPPTVVHQEAHPVLQTLWCPIVAKTPKPSMQSRHLKQELRQKSVIGWRRTFPRNVRENWTSVLKLFKTIWTIRSGESTQPGTNFKRLGPLFFLFVEMQCWCSHQIVGSSSAAAKLTIWICYRSSKPHLLTVAW